jgi:hypothetical protein
MISRMQKTKHGGIEKIKPVDAKHKGTMETTQIRTIHT